MSLPDHDGEGSKIQKSLLQDSVYMNFKDTRNYSRGPGCSGGEQWQERSAETGLCLDPGIVYEGVPISEGASVCTRKICVLYAKF